MSKETDELKAAFAQKKQEIESSKANAAAKSKTDAAERQKLTLAGRKALLEVAIPFLREVKNTIGAEFKFAEEDAGGATAAAISFQIGTGDKYRIEALIGGVITVKTYPGNVKGTISGKPIAVFEKTDDPSITRPEDVTPKNLKKLVDIAIDHMR